MGIYKLNAFLNKYIHNSIKKKSLYQLRGKTVGIDFSIFYYKFKKTRSKLNFIESFRKQIDTFKFYDIEPIYIFDGRPPNDKFEIINIRNKEIQKYKDKIKNEKNIDLINKYKKKTVKLNSRDVYICKELFNRYNIKFIQAEGEADEICCKLYKNQTVAGIFTEDNDILLGGAVVYKGLNNYNDVIHQYDLSSILNELSIDYDTFLKICLLSGSTYTKKITCIFKLYEEYTSKHKIQYNKELYNDKEFIYKRWISDEIKVLAC